MPLWSRLCGPVFQFDLVRLSRRGSATLFVTRSLYVASLLLLLLVLYVQATSCRTASELAVALRAGCPLPVDRSASFASSFCHTFLMAQLAVALVLTPAFTAGALSEERSRRNLDFVLATDLSSREIIVGKWLAHLAQPMFVLLAGLPVLGLMQLLGGVQPSLILAGFAATLLTMASLGAVGMLVSLSTTRPPTAILFTYAIAALYLLLSRCVPPDSSLSHLFGAGNPLVALERLENGLASGRSLDPLPRVFLEYALFHGTVLLLCLMGCIRQLRRPRVVTPYDAAEALLRRHAAQLPSPAALEAARARIAPVEIAPRRAALSARPILWRELHVETGLLQTRDFFGFLVSAAIGMGLILVGLSLLLVLLHEPAFLGNWVRWVGTSAASLLLLGIALRAAGSFTRERERQTLESLLASPLSNRDIVLGKLLGSLLSVRRGIGCLALVWLLGVVSGGLKLSAVLVLLLTWLGYALLAASLGVFCSLHSRSTWRATVATLLILSACWILPDVLCLPVFSPPEALMFFASVGQTDTVQAVGMKRETLYSIFVLFICNHYIAALGFWHLTLTRFGSATGRIEGRKQPSARAAPSTQSALPSPPSRSLC